MCSDVPSQLITGADATLTCMPRCLSSSSSSLYASVALSWLSDMANKPAAGEEWSHDNRCALYRIQKHLCLVEGGWLGQG